MKYLSSNQQFNQLIKIYINKKYILKKAINRELNKIINRESHSIYTVMLTFL